MTDDSRLAEEGAAPASNRARVEEIVRVSLEAGLALRPRDLLLRGLPSRICQNLRCHQRPSDQLTSDVQALADLPPLEGMDQPCLQVWLENAAGLAEPHHHAVYLRRLAGLTTPEQGSPGVPKSEAPLRLLIDNWLMESAADLLQVGPQQGHGTLLMADGRQVPTPSAALDVMALATLLTALVLRDDIGVDKDWAYVWRRKPMVAELHRKQIIKSWPFVGANPRLRQTTPALLPRLTVSEELVRMQRANEAAQRAGATFLQFPFANISPIVWGGAGYLARAHLANLPYMGHPARMHFFEQTIFSGNEHRPDPSRALTDWVSGRRSDLVQILGSAADGLPKLSLPPIFGQIAADASGPDRLIPVALELREQFTPVRRWLSAWQAAQEEEDMLALARHHEVLDDTWAKAQSTLRQAGRSGERTEVTAEQRIVDGRSVQGLLQRLILGKASLNRLLNVVGLERGPLRLEVEACLGKMWA